MKIEELKDIMLEIAEIIQNYPEQLQEKVFDIITENIFGKSEIIESISESTELEKESNTEKTVIAIENDTKNNDKKSKKRNGVKETYQISKDLNLAPKDAKSLKDFVNEKKSKIKYRV